MSKINFQNLPSTSTPLNATNMNAIQWNMQIDTVLKPDESIQGGTEKSYDVLFPTSFSTAPRIVLVTVANDKFITQVQNITTTGFKLWIRNVMSSSTSASIVSFTYLAIE